ncbi:MAG: hypothetical protein LBC12_07170 [Nitrososphaerota archaeon]|nr:hypothetical protein [Nitrososphaerota archaeon]
MSKSTKSIKQLIFDNLTTTVVKQDVKTKSVVQKQICITKIESVTGIDELILRTCPQYF